MNSTILVAGAGSLGCENLKLLALMGVGTLDGHIQLIDSATVKRTNLTNQFMFSIADLNNHKVAVAER